MGPTGEKSSITMTKGVRLKVRVMVSTEGSELGEGAVGHCVWCCSFSGPGAETQRRPGCYLWFEGAISAAARPEVVFQRLFDADQDLAVLRA